MGFIEQLKKVVNWESAIVLIVFFGCLTAIIIFGANQGIEILYIGGLVALGIPTSIFGNLAQRATTATIAANNPIKKDVKKKDEEIRRIELTVAELANQFANLKSTVELMMIGLKESDCYNEQETE